MCLLSFCLVSIMQKMLKMNPIIEIVPKVIKTVGKPNLELTITKISMVHALTSQFTTNDHLIEFLLPTSAM